MRSKGQKNRFSLYISDEALDMARQWYAADDCTSMSEYIEKAVQFYSGYLATDKNENYVSNIVLSTLKGIMDDTENRHNGSLFRIAVELSMIKNILAFNNGISGLALDKLRGDCVKEVKQINGSLSYEEAIRWQT